MSKRRLSAAAPQHAKKFARLDEEDERKADDAWTLENGLSDADVEHRDRVLALWTARFKAWKNPMQAGPISKPIERCDWQSDYSYTVYRPWSHSVKFLLLASSLADAGIRAPSARGTPPTQAMTELINKYIDSRYIDGVYHHSAFKESLGSTLFVQPEELFALLLFDDYCHEDFVKLAQAMISEGIDSDEQDDVLSRLLACCMWAIDARQMPWRPQQDFTRAAFFNLDGLILAHKLALPVIAVNWSYEYKIQHEGQAEVTVWLPDLTEFWFHIELKNFWRRGSYTLDTFRHEIKPAALPGLASA